MIVKSSEIALGIRIKPFLEKLGNNGSLRFERACRYIHELVEPAIEIFFV